jgi:predicted acetyltransferase
MSLLGSLPLGTNALQTYRKSLKGNRKKKRQNMFKLKDEYDNLLAKVNAVKAGNMPPEKWSASQLHVMVKWYKHDDDNALPS